MPVVPPTRKKHFTKYVSSCRKSSVPFQSQIKTKSPITTLDISKEFIRLLNNSNNEQEKLKKLAENITDLYFVLSFSTKQFVHYIVEQSLNKVRLLEYYYKLYKKLDVQSLSIPYLLDQIPSLNEHLLELFLYDDSIAGAYIPFLSEDSLKTFFDQDGKQLVQFINGHIKREKSIRLLYIIEYYHQTMKSDQLLMQLLSLGKLPVQESNQVLFRLKKNIFSTLKFNKDFILLKIPICEYIIGWFFEFNMGHQDFKFIDFLSNIIQLNSMQPDEIFDVSFLYYLFDLGCQILKREGTDVIRIFDIVYGLNKAVKLAIEQDNGHLPYLFTLAQITFEHLSVGYTYITWFESLFVNPEESILNNKRSQVVFLKILLESIPFEIPSVLQIHGKALLYSSILNTTQYISSTKKRLLELGVDPTLKNYPSHLKTPLMNTKETVVIKTDDETILNILTQFKEKKSIPASLLQSHIFKRQWFYYTFLPKLFNWKGPNQKEKDELISVLKQNQKIPDSIFQKFNKQ